MAYRRFDDMSRGDFSRAQRQWEREQERLPGGPGHEDSPYQHPAFVDGYEAREAGALLADGPDPDEEPERAHAWRLGWQDADDNAREAW